MRKNIRKNAERPRADKAAKSRPKARTRGTWAKGTSGNPAGRKPGTHNKATLEAKAFCQGLVMDTIYQRRLKRRLLDGDLAPGIEMMIWYYAAGKPKETLALTGKSFVDHVKDAIENSRHDAE